MTNSIPGEDQSRILSVRDLTVGFRSNNRVADVVRGVSFDVFAGETLCVVGESGSGKSVTFQALLGLLARPSIAVSARTATLRGRDLLTATDSQLAQVRGKDVGVVFQDPFTSLDPLFTVGAQLSEALLVHNPSMQKRTARTRSAELLRSVGIPDVERRLDQYPHQFSGGMRQRVMIAIAVANSPELLIADEPTTALDVTVQAQVLEQLLDSQRSRNAAMVLITHDLRLVQDIADRVLVMYAGKIVESGPASEVLGDPKHWYTRGLLGSLPGPGKERLTSIVGAPPRAGNFALGCAFQPRCPRGADEAACKTIDPAVTTIDAVHETRCHFPPDGANRDNRGQMFLATARGVDNGNA